MLGSFTKESPLKMKTLNLKWAEWERDNQYEWEYETSII